MGTWLRASQRQFEQLSNIVETTSENTSTLIFRIHQLIDLSEKQI